MTNKKVANLLKQIDERMKGVASERDKLDEMISTAEALKEDCENAYDALQDARDALSELV